MKEVSVIAIAKRVSELDPLRKALSKQTFKDFELLTSTRKGIPQAMNDAITRANGSIIVVTESDAIPLTNTWLEEMVKAVKEQNRIDPKKKTLVRGIEVSPLPWCWCNLACYSSVLKNNKLKDNYPVAEDTELFARLNSDGYRGVELPIAPVLHSRRERGMQKSVKNSFIYGMLLTGINIKYGNVGFGSGKKAGRGVLYRELTIIFSRISFLFGAMLGMIFCRPRSNK